jgi:multiple sugar transport system ATP-binding protein
VSGEGYRLPLPESLRARTQELRSKEVTVGIRPSAFSIADDSTQGVQLDLPVVLPEYIGSQSVIVSRLGGQQIQIEISSDTPLGTNEILSFTLDPKSIYLFDPQTEATL